MSFEIHKARFTRTFCAAHRLLYDDSPCHRIHGHNYKAEVLVVVQKLDSAGFVIHADRVKRVIDEEYDHQLILNEDDLLSEEEGIGVVTVPFEPTVENLAQYIASGISVQIGPDQGSGYVEVWLEEVPTISAMGRVEW